MIRWLILSSLVSSTKTLISSFTCWHTFIFGPFSYGRHHIGLFVILLYCVSREYFTAERDTKTRIFFADANDDPDGHWNFYFFPSTICGFDTRSNYPCNFVFLPQCLLLSMPSLAVYIAKKWKAFTDRTRWHTSYASLYIPANTSKCLRPAANSNASTSTTTTSSLCSASLLCGPFARNCSTCPKDWLNKYFCILLNHGWWTFMNKGSKQN